MSELLKLKLHPTFHALLLLTAVGLGAGFAGGRLGGRLNGDVRSLDPRSELATKIDDLDGNLGQLNEVVRKLKVAVRETKVNPAELRDLKLHLTELEGKVENVLAARSHTGKRVPQELDFLRLQKDVEFLMKVPPPNPVDLSGLKARFKRLEDQVDDLSAAKPTAAMELTGLKARFKSLEARVADLLATKPTSKEDGNSENSEEN